MLDSEGGERNSSCQMCQRVRHNRKNGRDDGLLRKERESESRRREVTDRLELRKPVERLHNGTGFSGKTLKTGPAEK